MIKSFLYKLPNCMSFIRRKNIFFWFVLQHVMVDTAASTIPLEYIDRKPNAGTAFLVIDAMTLSLTSLAALSFRSVLFSSVKISLKSLIEWP